MEAVEHRKQISTLAFQRDLSFMKELCMVRLPYVQVEGKGKLFYVLHCFAYCIHVCPENVMPLTSVVQL